MSVRAEIGMSLFQTQALSQTYEARLKKIWDGRNANPFAYTPKEELDRGISLDDSLAGNKGLGEFGVGCIKYAFRQKRPDQSGARKKVVACGYGRGYDSDWLKDAWSANLEPWWLDVSPVACNMAEWDVADQVQRAWEEGITGSPPVIKEAELRNALLDPGSIDLELESVQFWYFCRVLGCLSERSARIVLQRSGRSLSAEFDPDKANAIVIVNALKGCNPHVDSDTSKIRSKRMMVYNIRKGAGRAIRVHEFPPHRYFRKAVSGLMIEAA